MKKGARIIKYPAIGDSIGAKTAVKINKKFVIMSAKIEDTIKKTIWKKLDSKNFFIIKTALQILNYT